MILTLWPLARSATIFGRRMLSSGAAGALRWPVCYELIGLGEHDDLGNSDSHRFAVGHGNHHVHFEPLIERSFDAKPALVAGFP